MNIFSGLEALGFIGMDAADLFKIEKKKNEAGNKNAIHADDPMRYIFIKEFECAVCGHRFMNPIVRKSKLRLVKTDTDMKNHYQTVEPSHYEVLVCDLCGYAATMTSFNRISDKQIELILRKIRPLYKPKLYDVPYSAEDAIERYKLALLCAVTKGAKASEKAILCLRIAWLYRDICDWNHELLFLKNAFTGLKAAYESEPLPIGSMDENTVQYIIGELARRVGEDNEAMRWIGGLVVRKDVPKHLKERAMNVRDMIRTDRAK